MQQFIKVVSVPRNSFNAEVPVGDKTDRPDGISPESKELGHVIMDPERTPKEGTKITRLVVVIQS